MKLRRLIWNCCLIASLPFAGHYVYAHVQAHEAQAAREGTGEEAVAMRAPHAVAGAVDFAATSSLGTRLREEMDSVNGLGLDPFGRVAVTAPRRSAQALGARAPSADEALQVDAADDDDDDDDGESEDDIEDLD